MEIEIKTNIKQTKYFTYSDTITASVSHLDEIVIEIIEAESALIKLTKDQAIELANFLLKAVEK